MVGRDKELGQLQTYLDEAKKGNGRTVFVSGEAGIGKSRMVDEVEQLARSKGFQVLTGYSLGEALTPYMPFLDALRSGGLESLFSEAAPRVEAVYLVTHSGLLIGEAIREETELEPDIFTAMLTTVGVFVQDSLSQLSGEERKGKLSGLIYGDHEILIESGQLANLVTISAGGKNEFLIEDMKEVLWNVSRTYGKALEKWDGDEKKVEGIEKLLEPLITSGKYDGTYYGKEDPKARRNLLFENVSLGLMRNAKEVPTLLTLEDLQWADPSSLSLMHYVARNTKDSGMLIFGTYRPEDVTVTDGKVHPLIDTMQLMDREDLVEQVRLERLPQESMDVLLTNLIGENRLDDEFKRRLHKETEGNPLFIIQLVRHMMEEKIIGMRDGKWELKENLQQIDIPSKIHSVISRRISRVEGEQRRVIDFASVIGEVFNPSVLAKSLEMEKVLLLENLRALEQTHKLIKPQNGDYRFDHSKMKEVLYGEIPETLRQEYHEIIARNIEEMYSDNVDEVIGDLAFHYYQGKNKEKALDYLIRAAESAQKEYSNEEAMTFHEEALELEEDRHKKAELLKALGDISRTIGEKDRSMSYYAKALDYATEDVRIGIQRGIALARMEKGEFDEAIGIIREALSATEGEASQEAAKAYLTLAHLYSRRDIDKSSEYCEMAREICSGIDDLYCQAESARIMGLIHSEKGEWEKAIEYSMECLRIQEQRGDQTAVASSHFALGYIYDRMDKAVESLGHYKQGLLASEMTGNATGIGACKNGMAAAYTSLGKMQEALEMSKDAIAMAKKIGNRHGLAATYGTTGNIYACLGDFKQAHEYLDRSKEELEKIGEYQDLAMVLRTEGSTYTMEGKYDDAIGSYEKSLEISKRLGDELSIGSSYSGLSESLLLKGNLKAALYYCSLATEIIKGHDEAKATAWSARINGNIYRERGLWDESISQFEKSIELNSEIGDRDQLGLCHLEFGLMWKMKGDKERARTHLNKAIGIFEDVGMQPYKEEADKLLQDLGA